MKQLGKALADLRKDQNLTLIEVSKKSGIDQATLSRIENGKMVGTLESHIKISAALECDLLEFYTRAFRKNNGKTSLGNKNSAVAKRLAKIEEELKEIIKELS